MAALPCVVALLVAGPVVAAQSVDRYEFSEPHMGTAFRIVLYAADRCTAEHAAASAYSVVERLDSTFSDYHADSEVSRLSSTEAGQVRSISPELARLLTTASLWSKRTHGAFDVTVGPLTRLWRWSSRRGELPDEARLAEAKARVGYESLEVDGAAHTIVFERAGMALDLGGIAKGYAADAALAELRRLGFERAFVDAGGDLALGVAPPGRKGWRVDVPGHTVLWLAETAVATSGDRHRYVEIDGVRYSHILDPRTGHGMTTASTVTVVAPDATTADVLATALGLMDAEAGATLVRSLDGASAAVTGETVWSLGDVPLSKAESLRGVNR